MSDLTEKRCQPCEGGVPPLGSEEVARLAGEVKGWRAEGVHHIEKDFSFKNFRQALDFVNRVGELAEEENHHPDITFTWGKAHIEIRTHKIDGLSENDFILAAKIDALP